MAISDVLFDAGEMISDYLHNQPSMYAEVRPQIDTLLADMERIRVLLDTPPLNDPAGPLASVSEALTAALHPRH